MHLDCKSLECLHIDVHVHVTTRGVCVCVCEYDEWSGQYAPWQPAEALKKKKKQVWHHSGEKNNNILLRFNAADAI